MIGDTHRRLRDATQADHQRLDHRIDIFRRIGDADARRVLVRAFHGLHRDAEAALAPWLLHVAGLDFHGRRRTPRLAKDLAALGGAPVADAPIDVGGVGEALGLMYVLEGSTLGGRIIRRQVEAAGGDMIGLSFLDPYGDRVGERWRSFLAVLEAEAGRGVDAVAMIAGARAGFCYAERRLCEDCALV